jgi:hypothetical protein
MDNDSEMLRQTYQLAKENNKMLHAMRRNAFFGGLFKLIIYAALLLVPFYLYMQYLAPVINQLLNTMNQIQGAGTQAQVQMTEWQKTFQELQNKIPVLSSTPKQ